LYDIPLTVSIAWIAAAPLLARRLQLSDSKPSRPVLGVWITRLGMLALFSLLWASIQAEWDQTIPSSVRGFRITASLLTLVVMGVLVFWRQRLLRAELSRLLHRSRRSFTDLEALQQKLIQSEKLASLGQLVGGAAHEINNPLTAMLGYSDLLSASTMPAEEQLQAAQIGEQVRRTTTLVASLLTFARQSPAQLATVDINSVMQTAVRLRTHQFDGEAGSIRIELAPGLPMVLADSNQILHVCMHLAGQINARRTHEPNSLLLIRTHSQGDSVLVDFSSHDPSAALHFFSLLGSEGPNRPSTLSLGACCRIVEEHGGRLLQSSTPGKIAFRMELRTAPNAVSRPSYGAANRAAAHSSS
jgi:nitrogen-specific signal transduction histidine kinase